jgi:hypothetical protein
MKLGFVPRRIAKRLPDPARHHGISFKVELGFLE